MFLSAHIGSGLEVFRTIPFQAAFYMDFFQVDSVEASAIPFPAFCQVDSVANKKVSKNLLQGARREWSIFEMSWLDLISHTSVALIDGDNQI